jgi:hypothetical protein
MIASTVTPFTLTNFPVISAVILSTERSGAATFKTASTCL